MRFKSYPQYKNSEEIIVDKIPFHWKLQRNKIIFSERKKIVGNNHLNYKLLSLTLNGVIYRDMENMKGKFPAEFNTYKIVYPNDFVFCLFDIDETPRSLGLSTLKGMITGAYNILSVKDVNLKYLFYYFLQIDNNKKLKPYYKGLRKTISISNFMRLRTPIPPSDEQIQIAKFLDWKTHQIDTFIKNKKKLIELLKEQKQNIINTAVTKGLEPHVKMKDSGVEWIGDIPVNWEVKKLRHVGVFQNGVSEGSEYFGSGFPFVNYTDVYNNSILPQNVSGQVKSTEKDRERFSVQKGDVFFTRTSEVIEEIAMSSVCFNEIKNSVFSGFLIRFRPIQNILYEGFSQHYFRASIHRNFFVKEMNIVTRASLSQKLLKMLPVLIPSFDEQIKIANYLNIETSLIDKTISRAEKEIELIQEYRERLISDVVTGKVDVRNIEIPSFESMNENDYEEEISLEEE